MKSEGHVQVHSHVEPLICGKLVEFLLSKPQSSSLFLGVFFITYNVHIGNELSHLGIDLHPVEELLQVENRCYKLETPIVLEHMLQGGGVQTMDGLSICEESVELPKQLVFCSITRFRLFL